MFVCVCVCVCVSCVNGQLNVVCYLSTGGNCYRNLMRCIHVSLLPGPLSLAVRQHCSSLDQCVCAFVCAHNAEFVSPIQVAGWTDLILLVRA